MTSSAEPSSMTTATSGAVAKQDQADEALVRQRLDQRPAHRRPRVQRDRDPDQHIADREAGGGASMIFQMSVPLGIPGLPGVDMPAEGEQDDAARPEAQRRGGGVKSSAMQRSPLGRGR